MHPKSKRDQIIEVLYTGKNFNDFIQKMEPAHLREDLKQEVAMVICEMADDKITDLFARKELDYYIVRVTINMLNNPRHPFYKKFRTVVQEYSEYAGEEGLKAEKEAHDHSGAFAIEERLLRELTEDFTLTQIEGLYWYDRDLLKLYLQVRTFRALESVTGIPYSSCHKNINKSILVLRQKALSPKPLFTRDELKFIQNGESK